MKPLLLVALTFATAAFGGERMVVRPKSPAPPAPQAYLRPVGPDDPYREAETAFPEANGKTVVAWMEGAFAFGASETMTVLKRTETGYRVVHLGREMRHGAARTHRQSAGRKRARHAGRCHE